MINWRHIFVLGLCLCYKIHIHASDILNFRHGRSKDRHLYGRSKILWGLQVFDNISWSFSLFNQTDNLEMLQTSYSMSRNANHNDEDDSSKFAIIYNDTNLNHNTFNTIIDQMLNKNMIIDTYLKESITIKPHKMDQSKLKHIFNYVNHMPSENLFGAEESSMEFTLEKFRKLNEVQNVALTNGSIRNTEQPAASFEKITEIFERQKKNSKLNDKQLRINPTKGYDILTEHLQIIESQNSKDCTAGTSKSLGEGVVDNSRFQIEANVAVNRANMLTRYLQSVF